LDDSGSWDGNAAIGRMRVLAGGPDKDKMDWVKYKKGFVWFDEGDKENFSSYKLPFADVKGGKLTAIWGGVAAAMKAILGARGGVNIPDEDKKKCYNFLASYYRKFDKPVPEMSSVALLQMELEDMEDFVRSAINEVLEVLKTKGLTGVDLAMPNDQVSTSESKGKGASETILGEAFKSGRIPSSPPPSPSAQYDIRGVIMELKNLRESLKLLKGV
jgi:hypothetical protein